jgi:S1-C subfamily serine protease
VHHMKTATGVLIVALFLTLSFPAWTQDAVPGEILERTIFIKGPTEAGSAFSIDFEGKIYLITARHVVAGVPMTNATLQIWQGQQWKDYHTVKTIFPGSGDVDIAIFETNEKASKPYEVPTVFESGSAVMFGQRVWFVGYPFGIETHFASGQKAPFVKSGTMSALDASNSDAMVLYIDAFNNPGFSGGPIVFWDSGKKTNVILGVVQGYREDTAKVLVNGQHLDTQLLVNTGILVGYSVRHAMEAIRASTHPQSAAPK